VAQQTLINGNRFSFSNVFVNLNGVDVAKGVFKAISYDSEQTSGEVNGNQVVLAGLTEGTAKGTGSFEMLLSDANDFMSQLSSAGVFPVMSVDFDIIVQYSVNDVDVVTDQLRGCRIQKVGTANQQGPDATTRTFEILIRRMIENGNEMFGDRSGI
jgi:hypothetical protein